MIIVITVLSVRTEFQNWLHILIKKNQNSQQSQWNNREMFVVGTCLLTILTPPHPQHTHTPVHFYLQSLGGTSLETFMFVDKVWRESRAYRDRQLGHKLRGFEMSCEYI